MRSLPRGVIPHAVVVTGASLALLALVVGAPAHEGAHQRPHATGRISPAEAYHFLMVSGAGGHFHNLMLSHDLEVLLAGTHLGLFRSQDRGLTWRLAAARFGADDVHAVVRVPDQPLVYVATHNQGILRSTDGGLRWSPHHHGLPGRDVHALSLDPQHPSRLYAWVVGHGLYRSDDGGDRWRRLAGAKDLIGVESLAVQPRDPDRLYAATIRGVWVSDDGGRHWRFPDGGLSHRAAWVALPPWAPDRLLAATLEGAFVGAADGSEWKALAPPPAWWGPITSFAFTEDRPGIVFTVTHEGVVAARHMDDGDWTPLAEFREAAARLKQANDLSALPERVRRSP